MKKLETLWAKQNSEWKLMLKIRDKDYWFIAKVQVSIEVSGGAEHGTLIYDKKRTWQYTCERSFGESILGDDLKGFFKMCHKKDGTLYVDKRVKDRAW